MNGKDLMTGMLIMGINPRRIFDEDYLSWIRLCSRHIAAAMNLTQSVEEAAQKAEELAALNRNRTAFFNRLPDSPVFITYIVVSLMSYERP